MFDPIKTVVLEPVKHIYTNVNTKEELVSVSKFFEEFKEDFDRDRISWMMARKELRLAIDPEWYAKYSKQVPGPEPTEVAIKKGQEAILADWDNKLVNSQDVGTELHKVAENAINGVEIDPDYADLETKVKNYFRHYYKTNAEMVMYSDEYMVAGTEDANGLRTRSKKGLVDLCDFKSNVEKGITFDSTKLQDDGKLKHSNRFFLGPIKHIEDCNYNEYALKLSLYGVLLEESYGMKVGKLFLLFIREVERENGERRFKLEYHGIPYMRTDAIIMLKHYRMKYPFKKVKMKAKAKAKAKAAKAEKVFGEEDF